MVSNVGFQRVRAELLGIIDFKSSSNSQDKSVGPTGKDSVYHSVLDDPALPPSEKKLLRLEQEGALLVLAGAESPAKTLNIIFYHLLANLSILSKLRSELDTIIAPDSWAQLDQLPYLSAIIEEGNRLSFGVTARTARISHESLKYTPSIHVSSPHNDKSFSIPPGTPVSVTTLSAHTAETIFPDPFKFDPERWLGAKGRELRTFQMAFGRRGRKCLGLELARAELCLVIGALAKTFDMTFWQTDESDIEFVHDFHVAMPRLSSKGIWVTAKAL